MTFDPTKNAVVVQRITGERIAVVSSGKEDKVQLKNSITMSYGDVEEWGKTMDRIEKVFGKCKIRIEAL